MGGIEIIERACSAPAKAIANNSGVEGAIVVGELMKNESSDIGYNAQNAEYVNMIEAGIMDPTKVCKTSLVDAFSVAGLLMTTEAMIADDVEDTPNAPWNGRRWNGRYGRYGRHVK